MSTFNEMFDEQCKRYQDAGSAITVLSLVLLAEAAKDIHPSARYVDTEFSDQGPWLTFTSLEDAGGTDLADWIEGEETQAVHDRCMDELDTFIMNFEESNSYLWEPYSEVGGTRNNSTYKFDLTRCLEAVKEHRPDLLG